MSSYRLVVPSGPSLTSRPSQLQTYPPVPTGRAPGWSQADVRMKPKSQLPDPFSQGGPTRPAAETLETVKEPGRQGGR